MIKLFCPLFWIRSISPLGDWVSHRPRDRCHVNERKNVFWTKKRNEEKEFGQRKNTNNASSAGKYITSFYSQLNIPDVLQNIF